MTQLHTRSKSSASKANGRKVYFTCHPEDFAQYFDKICTDIFQSHDCVIYYTQDMSQDIEDLYSDTGLNTMHLFVVPVTQKLLTTANRAMDRDLAYAKAKQIPILPIAVELGIDPWYSAPEKFGERQYLPGVPGDKQSAGYYDKLKNHLESVLVSNKLAKRVRNAFDAYVFLSYRKKDKHYANALLKRIHAMPQYRDVAVWYDEFLTLGKSFRRNINKMLKESRLFALLVTPNLLEYVDGKPNYVMRVEYPRAKKQEIPVLPMQMEPLSETELAELSKKYAGLPECVNPDEEDQFVARLAESLAHIAKTENDAEPEHNFLIGIAYLNGIDVEKDTQRGLELVTSAARKKLPEAMHLLYRMYLNGENAPLDYREAAHWAEAMYEHYKAAEHGESENALGWLGNYASVLLRTEDHKKALAVAEPAYRSIRKVLGEGHPFTMSALHNLAVIYGQTGDKLQQFTLLQEVAGLRRKYLGEKHIETLKTYDNLYTLFGHWLEPEAQTACQEEIYHDLCAAQGEDHPDVLLVLNNLALAYQRQKDISKAKALLEQAYTLSCSALGPEHPQTLIPYGNLALLYFKQGEPDRAMEITQQVYALRTKHLGPSHPDTLAAIQALADFHEAKGDRKASVELHEQLYGLCCRRYGEDSPETLEQLGALSLAYAKADDDEKRVALEEKGYAAMCRIYTELHPVPIGILSNIAALYSRIGDKEKALARTEMLYDHVCRYYGPDSQEAKNTKMRLDNHKK